MGRRLKHDIPGPDRRVTPEEAAEKGWPAIFDVAPDALRLVVDIGFGRGEFLMDLAENDPDGSFLGIEYSFKRVLKMARRLARTDLRNVRLVEAPGRDSREKRGWIGARAAESGAWPIDLSSTTPPWIL